MSAPPDGQIEITPEMIEAGVEILWDQYGIIGPPAAEDVAREIFAAMISRAPGYSVKDEDIQTDFGGNESGA